MQAHRIPFKVVLPFVLLLASVAVGAFAIHAGSTKQPPASSAAGPVHSPVQDLQPGPVPEQDGLSLDQWETFWTNRLTYPTGRFDPAWLRKAEAQDSLIQRAVPAGTVVYNHAQSHSPLTLDPNSFISLGPRPVTSFGENWSGRVNSIAIDPVTTNVAYMAVNGAGIWKTTNCCITSTTWLPVTDLPADSDHRRGRCNNRPARPQYNLRGHRRPQLHYPRIPKRGHPEEHRPGRDLDRARRGCVRPALP